MPSNRSRIAFRERAWAESRARRSDSPNARNCRARREKLRAAHLCIFCGRRPAVKGSLCQPCHADNSTRGRERYDAQIAARGGKVRPYRRAAGKGGAP